MEQLFYTENVYDDLKIRKKLLMDLLNKKIEACQNCPEGSVRIVRLSDKVTKCYHRKNTLDRNGTYIKKQNMTLVNQLAQKEYDQEMIETISREIKVIDKLIENNAIENLDKIIYKFPTVKQEYITPIYESRENYAKEWKTNNENADVYMEDGVRFLTKNNESVRSKSEMIIANMFYEYDVPYCYETIIKSGNKIIARPDFKVLNTRTRREYYWEHFGMMDTPEYANKCIKKLEAYEQNGYFVGDKLLISFESSENAINISDVEAKIKKYLL